MQGSEPHYPPRAPHDRVHAMVEGLRSAGLKVTPQRLAIVREVAGDESHPSAQELFERLRRTLPTMSFATVYNTLSALCEAGLGGQVSLAPGSSRFDPNTHPHDHIVCDGCGAVRDVPPAGTPRPGMEPGDRSVARAAPGFSVRSVERIFRGQCVDCRRAAERSDGRKSVPAVGVRKNGGKAI